MPQIGEVKASSSLLFGVAMLMLTYHTKLGLV
jgi:hypothetical protein